MQENSYQVKQSQQIYQYEFFSEGPKGRIRKMIQFQPMDDMLPIFNLAFGDWDENNETINDTAKSNNGDRQKILATVAQTVFKFMRLYPEATIIAKGSTPSRTRLYQMGLATFADEINKYFRIAGYLNNQWEPFKTNCNYEGFLLASK